MSNFEQLLEEYSTLAAYIDSKEDELSDIKKARDKIKAALMAEMNSIGISNARSTAGHGVCIVTNNSAKVVDGDAWYQFVFDNADPAYLTKHCSADAVKAYLDEHNRLPPGVEMVSAQTLRFTKAKA